MNISLFRINFICIDHKQTLEYRYVLCFSEYSSLLWMSRELFTLTSRNSQLSVSSILTPKLLLLEHDPKDVGPALNQTLKDLDTDYVDLYLVKDRSSSNSGP